MKLERPICFFDLETTGTDVQKDRIVEISICKLLPDRERITKTKRINPGIPIPAGASEVHKIYDVDVKDEALFISYAKNIHQFISGCDIGGFNSNRFDAPLLYNEFLRAGIEWDYSDVNFIDVGNIFKIREQRTLVAAAKFYLDLDITQLAHSAEVDTIATVDVFEAMYRKYEDLPTEVSELALYSNFDKKILDLSGWFSEGVLPGEIIFNRGKYIGEPIKAHRDYLQWMLGRDFPTDTLKICKEYAYSY